ncbi:SCL-interrupting locus protein homolog isoform X2 [Dreissena polymorpha]|uniref:SCL-interrupting locus protein homolog isoform X2 n=1 Tax=Dreissena polymorpha TaxID=45954 RepID=UPI002264B536|nr:SCL-interrupting locus protein homolog isoform X2 [Dreissena polymorpha]XP_052257478.1 SCL-interrupting locus protein homolog isoform X2 [Dreissena polymorpha]XP_052257479.1 SCL-interrupting locus protein homolog isoform X2 [Dreissena polymorpha]
MAAILPIRNLPDSIRAHYNSKDINDVQMAREVSRQYQRNSEDGQILKFPSTKNVLWDHETLGESQTLHISAYRRPRLCVSEKILRFGQRHVDTSTEKNLSCVLVGSLAIDDDGMGVQFKVERLDTACDPNSSTRLAAGDMLIPFTVQNGSKERGSTEEDYVNAIKMLTQRCSSKDPVDLGNFLLVKGWCSFYTTGDTSVHHVEFEMVTMATEVKVTPITPVPIVPTALSKNLSGPMSISHMQGTPKTGYLTMDHTRKLLLVLESDPKVSNLPLVGIWVSGVSYVYSPYIWACCLRYLHNSHITDRVCSPPDPFLLVLYNPTHSKPEFYECCTAKGDNKLTFDLCVGYDALQINKMSAGSTDILELDLKSVTEGQKQEQFMSALAHVASSSQNESRRSLSPDPVSSDDITPRLKPAPYKSRLPMVQSMVPEVTLFFGDEDTTFVPNVQHPLSRPGFPGPEMKRPPVATSTPHQSSGGPVPSSSVPALQKNTAGNRPAQVPTSANDYMNFNNPNSVAHAMNRNVGPQTNAMRPDLPPVSQNINGSSVAASSSAVHPHHSAYPAHAGHPPAGGPVRLYCTCPSCPRPPPTSQMYGHPSNGSNFDPSRPSGPGPYPYPRPQFSNFGPPPPRLLGTAHFNGYPGPTPGSQSGMSAPACAPVPVHHSYPPAAHEYQHPASMPYSSAQPMTFPSSQAQLTLQGAPNVMQEGSQQRAKMQSENPRMMPTIPNASNIHTNSATPRPLIQQSYAAQSSGPMLYSSTAPAPQASLGLPSRVDDRKVPPQVSSQSGEDVSVNGSGEIRRSDQSSDNSGRSSDDSGLSFTPEKNNSPANPGPLKSYQAESSNGELKLSLSSVKWENIPPEIYQLLLRQEQQLKQLQAQIEVLQSQSLNNTTVESAMNSNQLSPQSVQKCSAGTNTSLAYNELKEQVSACMQTSHQQEQSDRAISSQTENRKHGNGNANANNRDVSSNSSGSGCETRTPLEIRHRGRLPMNSTQREDAGELDISQGELVALMNNMHDKTIDSMQSEMIVDLPSFQSSPSRSPRSQESCNESAFNLSPRSPISASMCDAQRETSETEEYTDEEEEDNTAGTDNPEYYNRLMDNIKKLLSQNTTETTLERDGYVGDISSDPNTPVKLAHENIKLGEHLQSFLRFDASSTKAPTDMTFIPKINYVSMFLDSSDTDTSMEINAMAMKYLKDEQLTQLTKLQAKNRLLQGSKKASEKTALLQRILKAEEESTPNVTTVGMSDNNLTFATKRYLERHGLLNDRTSGNTTASESTQNDSYQLRTNYSTMTSGSEDGVAQVTHEVLSTPASRRTNQADTLTPNSAQASSSPYENRNNNAGQDSSRNTYNDSRQSVESGYTRTPKPYHAMSRVDEHQRFLQNNSNANKVTDQQNFTPYSQNNSNTNKVTDQQNYTPYSQKPSPYLQSTRPDFGNGMGKYASPQITPAPNQNKFSPPSGAKMQPKNMQNQSEMPGVPSYYSTRQHREETNEDDRILDITRLKQLPKLL